MGLLNLTDRLCNIERADNNIKQSNIHSTNTGIVNIFDILNGDRTETIGDNFLRALNRNEQEETIRYNRKEELKRIKKEQGELKTDVEMALFKVRNIFGGREIKGKAKKYLNKESGNSSEELRNAGKKYFKERLGNTVGMNPKKIGEKLDKLYDEFCLQLMNLDEGDYESEQLLMGAISSLAADDRAKAARNFIVTGYGNTNVNSRARLAQECAVENLTTTDALGNVMSMEQATEYQNYTFANMNLEGIQESLAEIDALARNNEAKYNELLAKEASGTLTEEESLVLEQLKILHKNCIIGGYSGALTGLTDNLFIDDATATACCKSVMDSAEKYNLTHEVLKNAAEYVKSHPEIGSTTGRSFKAMVEAGSCGRYTLSETGTPVPTSASRAFARIRELDAARREEQQQAIEAAGCEVVQNKNNIAEQQNPYPNNTKTDPNNSESVLRKKSVNTKFDADNSGTMAVGEGHSTAKTGISNPNSAAAKNNDANPEQNKQQAKENALRGNVKAYKEYKEAYHVSNLNASVELINNGSHNIGLFEQGIEYFNRLTPEEKALAFERLSEFGQGKVESEMCLSELKNIRTFRSYYTKKKAETLINEKEEEINKTSRSAIAS